LIALVPIFIRLTHTRKK
jgi:hypothetical protein